jgi:hypothetical protein
VEFGEHIAISWVDPAGALFHDRARCIDVSEGGLRLELARRIEPGSYVNVRADKYHLNASARVRSVLARGARYHIGFEFNSGWKWRELARQISGELASAAK